MHEMNCGGKNETYISYEDGFKYGKGAKTEEIRYGCRRIKKDRKKKNEAYKS